jgi:RNA polymerase sigma-70 factor, ECF subfamily
VADEPRQPGPSGRAGAGGGVLGDLDRLHAEHAGALYAFAYRATSDRQAAEEIVQDTFVRAWRSADRFDPDRGTAGGWLFAIARNLVIDHHRRRGVRPVSPVPGDDLEAVDQDASPEFDRVVESWQVVEALGRLGPRHREAIVEVHLRGAGIAEAADRLGVPPGTVKSRLYYGLRGLRVVLEEMGVIR